ncbi:hypothetical protein SAMN05216319_3338 [Duganella sp. CF402]|uniref:AAA family ATPase n=1 Tax=unclassified Duganella TaxID=2636909 RepID=UPI0008CE2DBA|nr:MULTISPECIES: AAA family ATPase [unclassified Duganella]RZT08248.1 hypothetical protein EV582_0280 [Duganella sp. BK701]SEM00749.1 hypothetical protein SAMN05216319_3338 [Duganella sp. CF402]
MSNQNSSDQKDSANPFLDAISAQISTDDLERRLQRSPLAGIDPRGLSLQQRLDLLDRMQGELFEPTLTSIDIATRLYRMIRRGYLQRNPVLPAARKRAMTIARFAGQDIDQLPWLPPTALGMRVSGITGLGKSYEVHRALQLVKQVIPHGRSEAADWTHMLQASWLYIGMSFDGSIGGLLLQILVELDSALGTAYSSDRSLTRLSNEKLAVHVGITLYNHAVGAIIIDEIQLKNFSGARGGLAATFFLRLLNFGIPVVLMGNPLGMQVLDTYSQDMRRIGSGGTIEMQPLMLTDHDYTHFLAPAFWSYSVMDEATPINDSDGSLLYKYCGGIRDYGCRVLMAAQRLALDLGAKHITEKHLEQAFNGTDFSRRERDLIGGFVKKDPLILQQFDDIPVVEFAQQWGIFYEAPKQEQPNITTLEAPSSEGRPQDRTKSVAQKDQEKMLRQRTRNANAKASTKKTKETLTPEDMRSKGLKTHLIMQMELNRRAGLASPSAKQEK